MSDTVQFKATRVEIRLIRKAVDRALKLLPTPERSGRDWMMDFEATHSNGCPLDFEKFLAFDDFNFIHDAAGICRHLDRETGKLGDFFSPRCST